MKMKYKYLGKNFMLFALNGLIPKICAFLMIPVYTNYLSTYEYGVSDLVMTSVQLLLPVFSLDIQDAVMRYAMDDKHQKKDVLSVSINIIIKGSVLLFIIMFVCSFFRIFNVSNEFFLCVGVLYILNAFYYSFSLFCRGIDKVNIIVGASTINSIVLVVFDVLLIVIGKMGLRGYIIALVTSKMCAVIYLLICGKLFKYINFTDISKETQSQMIKFSFPLIFSVISWWINSASDRYIVSAVLGVSVSGIYAMAYTIPNILTLLQNVFSQAWSITAVKEFDRNDSDGFIGNLYESMNAVMVLLCSAVMSVNIWLSKCLFAQDFFEAWQYVPPLLISVVFNALALFVGSMFTAVKDTRTLAWSTIIGAIINTVCNVFFVSFVGAYGAALSTLIGYAVVFIARKVMLKKHISLAVKNKRNVISYGVLLCQMVIAYGGERSMWMQSICFIALVFLYKGEIGGIGKQTKSFIKSINHKKNYTR